MTEHKCNRCGAELKIVEVQVPVYGEERIDPATGHGLPLISHYETREEVADCPRCTGGY